MKVFASIIAKVDILSVFIVELQYVESPFKGALMQNVGENVQ